MSKGEGAKSLEKNSFQINYPIVPCSFVTLTDSIAVSYASFIDRWKENAYCFSISAILRHVLALSADQTHYIGRNRPINIYRRKLRVGTEHCCGIL